MGKVRTYRDLEVWQRGMRLAKRVYEITSGTAFPDSEKFGLISQMRRAAVSVPSNTAEGQARKGDKEFSRFLYMAKGSLAELDTQCLLAQSLGFLEESASNEVRTEIEELQRMLYALIRKLGGWK